MYNSAIVSLSSVSLSLSPLGCIVSTKYRSVATSYRCIDILWIQYQSIRYCVDAIHLSVESNNDTNDNETITELYIEVFC